MSDGRDHFSELRSGFEVAMGGDDRLPGGPEFFGDVGHSRLIGVENHDLRARGGECQCDRSTNPAAAAGYDRDLVFQQEIRKRMKHRLLSGVGDKAHPSGWRAYR